MANKLTVIAGPTAVGKGTVIKYILERHPEVMLSVSATTREPRPGEIDGVSYFFLTREQFEQKIAEGEMLEYAIVHGTHYYGTPKQPVVDAISQGRLVILEIDVQGVRQVKQSWPDVRTVFIAPPSWQVLVDRLRGRGTESPEDQQRRLETAKAELDASAEFDFVIVNDEVADCAAKVVDLLKS